MDEEKELERVLVLAENSESMDAIRLAAEVRRLRGRLEAVCGVVSDAAAFGDAVESADILEAVRGQREVRPKVITFDEIQAGDFLRVSFPPRGGLSDNWTIEHSRDGIAYFKHEADWITSDHQVLVSKRHDEAKIKLLARLQ